MNSRFFKRRHDYSNLLSNVKCMWNFLELNSSADSWKPHQSLERERKIRSHVFTSYMKSPIRKFLVLVVQWRQRNFLVIKPVAFCDVLVAVAVVVAKAPYFSCFATLPPTLPLCNDPEDGNVCDCYLTRSDSTRFLLRHLFCFIFLFQQIVYSHFFLLQKFWRGGTNIRRK